MLCQSHLHTASETFVHHKKFRSGSIFCVFTSVASILIGKDDKYKKKTEKRMRNFRTQCAMDLKCYQYIIHWLKKNQSLRQTQHDGIYVCSTTEFNLILAWGMYEEEYFPAALIR